MKKYKLTTNMALKLMAFIFAAFLWLIVANVDNPVSKSTYTDIPVQIVNDDVITQGGEVYQVLDEEIASVVVYAKRSVLEEINADDIVATADIKEMDAHTGLVPIKVTIPDYSGDYQSAESIPRNLQIRTEASGKAVFTLTVSSTGTPRDGYMLGDMKVNPEKVTISGAESKIKQIDRAVAKIKVSGISKDAEVAADLELYDADGNVISQSQLSNNLGEDGITVDVEVLEIKSVSLNFGVSGTPAEGYEFSGCTSEPESIQICGKEDVLDEITEIDVPAGEINIDGAEENVEKTVDIRPYLPDGAELVEDAAGDIAVTAVIQQEGTKSIDFLVSSMKINNLKEELQVSYEADAEVTLNFKGKQELLDALDISNAVSLDLQKCTGPGTYEIPVDVDVPDGITMTRKVTVQLTLEEKEEAASQGTEKKDDAPGEQDRQEDQNG